MDYLTKSTSRKELRNFSKLLRKLFGVKTTGKFPVLNALELLPNVFKNTSIYIVENNTLPKNMPARCYPDDNGNFTLDIKESVYNDAYTFRDGASLGFICHEICHVFLYNIGFTPIMTRAFKNNTIPAYCSVEWQTMALCSEVMLPYEETQGLSITELINKYEVSWSFANKRQTY